MDDDESDSDGLSGWAWYEMGRMDVQVSQRTKQTAAVLHQLFNPQPVVDVDALVAENQQLWQQLQALQAEFQRLRGANQSLYKWYEWAKDAKKTLAQRKAELAELRASNAALHEEYDAVVKLYDDLGHNYGKQFDQLTDLQKTVEKLRRGES